MFYVKGKQTSFDLMWQRVLVPQEGTKATPKADPDYRTHSEEEGWTACTNTSPAYKDSGFLVACTYIHNELILPRLSTQQHKVFCESTILPRMKDSETGTWGLKQVMFHVLNSISLLIRFWILVLPKRMWSARAHKQMELWVRGRCLVKIKILRVQMTCVCPGNNSVYK